MALGYRLQSNPLVGTLAASDEPNRYCIQLYHVAASQVDLTGKKVLEISCGAGGGASYIMRKPGPASYTGVDLNPASIDKCRERHQLPGLDLVQGIAEELPFPDESFDAVINVEASHQYPHFPRFLAEVARVLRPGGHFLYTDSRRAPVVAEWEAALANARLREVSERAIEEEAKRELAANTQRTQEQIGRRLPAFMNSLIRYGVGVLDWDLRRAGGVLVPGVLLREGLMRSWRRLEAKDSTPS